ncbi:MAG: ABC transporter ATP-binding protein [Chloroflexi bacterium]|nr:ABC transporter ATP-binding protein [Chloroflexota bacterium]
MQTVVEAEGLTKVYAPRHRGAKPVVAVDGIRFAVRAGQVFGFLGPNGAGKTTTIRMCTGITRPTAGRIAVSGFDIVADPIRAKERIGVVSDAAGLYTEMDAWGNLLFFASLHNIPSGKAAARAEHLLRLFGLNDWRHSPVGTFSTGMKKHLAIAVALMHEPAILFLDEPTTGLDVQSARQLRTIVHDLPDHGTTVFLTTHYIEEADRLCHRIAIISGGRVVAEGTPAELKDGAQGEHAIDLCLDRDANGVAGALAQEPCIREVLVTGERLRLRVEDPAVVFPLLLDTLGSHGLKVLSINTARPSLEDAFVRLTGLRSEVLQNEKEHR